MSKTEKEPMNKNTQRPALLTRSELDYLQGKEVSKPMIWKVRHEILGKLTTFFSLELPLLMKASESWPKLSHVLRFFLTTNGQDLTTNGKAQYQEITEVGVGQKSMRRMMRHAGFDHAKSAGIEDSVNRGVPSDVTVKAQGVGSKPP